MKKISWYKKIMLLLSVIFMLSPFETDMSQIDQFGTQIVKAYHQDRLEDLSPEYVIISKQSDSYIQTLQSINLLPSKCSKGRYADKIFIKSSDDKDISLKILVAINYLLVMASIPIFYKIIAYIYHKDGPRRKILSKVT